MNRKLIPWAQFLNTPRKRQISMLMTVTLTVLIAYNVYSLSYRNILFDYNHKTSLSFLSEKEFKLPVSTGSTTSSSQTTTTPVPTTTNSPSTTSSAILSSTKTQTITSTDVINASIFEPAITPDNPSTNCAFPKIEPFHPQMMKLIANNKGPINCLSGLPSLVYLDGDVLRINLTRVNETVGDKIHFCKYSPLILSKDDTTTQPKRWSVKFFSHPLKIPDEDEHLYVECMYNSNLVAQTFKSRIIKKPEIEKKREDDYGNHVKKNSPLETMNILFIGMDGVSKFNLMRAMPKTKEYITKHLNARELNKFNKVGDNTFPNIIPLLTGLNHTEFRERCGAGQYLDTVDDLFLWHNYQKSGYRTLLNIDVTWMSVFHYLRKGWSKPPFDYFNRPLCLQIEKDRKITRKGKGGTNCVGDTPQVTILHDYLLQMVSMFNNTPTKPYFMYNFFTYLTHDYQELATQGDDLYLELFRQLKEGNVLNNTLVIFFSDHGARFGSYRHTINGKIEVNSPFMFFIFPSWFEAKYPKAMETFQINQNRLITFFDIHKTMSEFRTFNGKTKKGNVEEKAISLFDEIPFGRTCTDAHIPMEYCNCVIFSNVVVPKDVYSIIISQLMKDINDQTKTARDKCLVLSLKKMLSIQLLMTNEEGKVFYQTTIETSPGGALYEALLEFNEGTRVATLTGTIVRLNLYKGQADCVQTIALKPFCFCAL